MRFVVAGGGVAGLASALALARAGHEAVVLERDVLDPEAPPDSAFDVQRRGIPHYYQPHAFLPRGRRILLDWAPDVYRTLLDVGAEPQDLALKLHGPAEPGDEDLVYLWVRRPLIEWALRRAVAAEAAIRAPLGVQVTGLIRTDDARPSAAGVTVAGGEPVLGDLRGGRARALPLPTRLAAGGGYAYRFRSGLLLSLLPPGGGRRASRLAAPQPARGPGVHGLQRLPRRQSDLRRDPAGARGGPRSAPPASRGGMGGRLRKHRLPWTS